MKTILRNLLVVSLTLMLGACASIQSPSGQLWKGRFSASIINGGHSERHTGTFVLEQDGQLARLTLRGPLGVKAAEIVETPTKATLETSEGVTEAKNSEQLMEKVAGTPISTRLLTSWLNGAPAPDIAHTTTRDGFEQAGWHIHTIYNADNSVRRISASRIANASKSSGVQLVLTVNK